MPPLPFRSDEAGISIQVRLTPRGGRDQLEGVERRADGSAVLKARVRAAPENGLANAALEKLLAAAFSVPPSSVAVVKGGTSRIKSVRIAGDVQRLEKIAQTL